MNYGLSHFGKRILFTAGGLMLLVGLTILAAAVNLGPFNTVVAMSISLAKASLIFVFFMEIRERTPLVWLALGSGILFLLIMFTLALSDFMARGWR